MTKKKKTIEEATIPKRVVKDTITLYNFPCDSDIMGLIGYLTDVSVKYGHDCKIEIRSDNDEYWSSIEVVVTTFRDETPREIEKRIAKAKKDAERAVVRRVEAQLKEEQNKKKQEAEELKLLQKLQKKYQGYTIEKVN